MTSRSPTSLTSPALSRNGKSQRLATAWPAGKSEYPPSWLLVTTFVEKGGPSVYVTCDPPNGGFFFGSDGSPLESRFLLGALGCARMA